MEDTSDDVIIVNNSDSDKENNDVEVISSKNSKEGEEIIHIDREIIPSIPLEKNFSGRALDNLAKLGVSAYNAEEVNNVESCSNSYRTNL